MKRKIKALKILLSDFYKAHEKKIFTTIMIFFMIIGAIMLPIYAYKDLEPENFSQEELKYVEEKVTEITNDNDIRAISNIVKEMKEKDYLVSFDYENQTITIDRNEATQVTVIFSYSSPTNISKEFSDSYAKLNQKFTTIISIFGGMAVGFVTFVTIGFIVCCIVNLLDIMSKVKSKYKKALEKVDLQSKYDKESESESIEQKEVQCIEEKEAEEDWKNIFRFKGVVILLHLFFIKLKYKNLTNKLKKALKWI